LCLLASLPLQSPWFIGLVFLWSCRVLAYLTHISSFFPCVFIYIFYWIYFLIKSWNSVFHLFQLLEWLSTVFFILLKDLFISRVSNLLFLDFPHSYQIPVSCLVLSSSFHLSIFCIFLNSFWCLFVSSLSSLIVSLPFHWIH
jgi:hypothetical protein